MPKENKKCAENSQKTQTTAKNKINKNTIKNSPNTPKNDGKKAIKRRRNYITKND